MNFIQMKCPNCNADLEVEDGIDSFYCKYCGTKILLEGQSNAAYTAKTVKHVADRILDQREARRAFREEEKRKQAEHDRKMRPIILAVGLFLFLLAFAAAFFMASKDESERTSNPQPAATSFLDQEAVADAQSAAQEVVDTINDFKDIFDQLK